MRILHLSDLHFVDGDGCARIESPGREPLGNARLIENIRRLADELESADVVIVSGDTTDTGTEAQWKAFIRTVHSFPGLAAKIILASGNHDLNHVPPTREFLTVDTKDFAGRRHRTALFRHAASDLAATSLANAKRLDVITNIDELFPAVRIEASAGGARVAFITINTVAPSTTFFGNAAGRFYAGQILSLVQTLQAEAHAIVVIGHHHPLPFFDSAAPAKPMLQRLKGIIQGVAMESVDGMHFLRQLEAVAIQPLLYLHGHKHIYRLHVERASGIRLCGAPSLLYGDESTGDADCIAARHEVKMHSGQVTFVSQSVALPSGPKTLASP